MTHPHDHDGHNDQNNEHYDQHYDQNDQNPRNPFAYGTGGRRVVVPRNAQQINYSTTGGMGNQNQPYQQAPQQMFPAYPPQPLYITPSQTMTNPNLNNQLAYSSPSVPRVNYHGNQPFGNGYIAAAAAPRQNYNSNEGAGFPQDSFYQGQFQYEQPVIVPSGDYHEEPEEEEDDTDDYEHLGNEETDSEWKPSPLKNQTPRRPKVSGKAPRKTIYTPASNRRTPKTGSTTKKVPVVNIPVWEGNITGFAGLRQMQQQRAARAMGVHHDQMTAAAIPPDAQLPQYAQRLFEAMMHEGPEGVDDHPSNNNDKPCQALDAIRRGHWPAAHVEERAWEILDALINRGAAYGVRLLPQFFKYAHENTIRHNTFVDRFTAVEDSLRRNKATVKNILDPQGHLDRLVDAPIAMIRQKENNKKVNAMRDQQNKIGRDEIKKRKLAQAAGGYQDDEEEEPAQESEQDVKPIVQRSSTKRPRQNTGSRRNPPRHSNATHATPAADEKDEEDAEESPRKRRQHNTRQSKQQKSKYALNNPQLPQLRQNPPLPPAEGEEDDYKVRLAKILGVDEEYAKSCELRQLRTYVRAYYNLNNAPWTFPADPNYWSASTGPFMSLVSGEGEKQHLYHFSETYMQLAIDRGDDTEFLPTLSNVEFVKAVTDITDQKALGMINNPFGREAELWGGVDEPQPHEEEDDEEDD